MYSLFRYIKCYIPYGTYTNVPTGYSQRCRYMVKSIRIFECGPSRWRNSRARYKVLAPTDKVIGNAWVIVQQKSRVSQAQRLSPESQEKTRKGISTTFFLYSLCLIPSYRWKGNFLSIFVQCLRLCINVGEMDRGVWETALPYLEVTSGEG